MAKIPFWAYVLIGGVISGFSWFVESRTEPGSLRLFFFVGLLFIAIGLGKLVFALLARNDARQAEKHLVGAHVSQNKTAQSSGHKPAQHHHHGQHHISTNTRPVQHPSIVACPGCGTHHYDYANFCMRCGSRIRAR